MIKIFGSGTTFNLRLRSLKKMEEKGLDVLLSLKPENIFYLSGFYPCYPDSVVISPISEKPLLIVPEYEHDRALSESWKKDLQTYKRTEKLELKIADALMDLKIKNVGVEGEFIPYNTFQILKKCLPSSISLTSSDDILYDLRSVKCPEEIRLVKKVAKLNDVGMQKGIERLEEGRKENEIAVEIGYAMMSAGADKISHVVVTSGTRTSIVHGHSTKKKRKKEDLVMINLGCIFKGYYSDMTRTIPVGKTPPKQREILDTVEHAFLSMVETITPGCIAGEAAKVPIKIIENKGYGKFVLHHMGRGIGLELSEKPVLVENSNEKLKTGMTLALNPAIYIPKEFGVRIEDMIMINSKGSKKLTKTKLLL